MTSTLLVKLPTRIIVEVGDGHRPLIRQVYRSELLEILRFMRQRRYRSNTMASVGEKDKRIRETHLMVGDRIELSFTLRMEFPDAHEAALFRIFFDHRFVIRLPG